MSTRFFQLIVLLASTMMCAHMTTAAETTRKGILVIGILTIESSYAKNVERPAQGVPDTLQFWIGPNSAWRIRTYATDHDIHPHSLGALDKMKEQPVEFAREHIKKHYGDVLASIEVLEFTDTNNTAAARQLLTEHKLKGSLEVAKVGFAFWNPDNGVYMSRTTPK